MFPGKELKFYAEWPRIASKIVTYCKNLPKNTEVITEILLLIEEDDLGVGEYFTGIPFGIFLKIISKQNVTRISFSTQMIQPYWPSSCCHRF